MITNLLSAQAIGVRAGWNFNKFDGPLEAAESFGFANGIHFGINYGYKLSNKLMIGAELLYNQAGSKHRYDSTGQSYYLLYTSSKTVFEKGKRLLNLEISNSYISLPITAIFKLSRKFEIFGGLSPNFLVNPTGRGQVRFESYDHPNQILFREALDYRYFQDVAKGAGNLGFARIIVDEKIVNIPKSIGAYYQYDVKDGNTFNWFSLSAIGGINYFINKGFYTGLRLERGLTDLTNDRMDVSLEKLNDDFSFIKRADKDIQLTYQISLGFRF